MQNAVYFANKNIKEIGDALDQGLKVIACEEDITIRGLKGYIYDNVEIKDYGEIIDIVLSNDSIINI
ncbi:MAG: DsrH/TusB family sulfur metabolism protein [Promethearchaeia archaeon]